MNSNDLFSFWLFIIFLTKTDLAGVDTRKTAQSCISGMGNISVKGK